MRLPRWKGWMSIVGVAVVSVSLVIPIERHKRAMGRRALFHAARARELWNCMKGSEIAAEGCKRRSKLAVPSEADEYWFKVGSGPPVTLTPEEWTEWETRFRGNVGMFRMMAEQREATERVYRRAMSRPWEPVPTNVISDYIE